jgi:hypothetical protein
MHDRRDDAGVSPVGPPRGPAGIARAAAIDGPDATAATTAAAATQPASAAGSTDAVAALVAALASGATTPAAALDRLDRLIMTTVASLRPADADPAVWAAIEAEVAAVLAGDPTLGDLLRP